MLFFPFSSSQSPQFKSLYCQFFSVTSQLPSWFRWSWKKCHSFSIVSSHTCNS